LRPAARESERGERRIFIQIPAYRDSELGATVRDLLKTARYPESLRIAILWQRGPNEELDLGFARGAELEVTEISHTNSRGCNWARAQLQQQWRGERFTLISSTRIIVLRLDGIKSCSTLTTRSSAEASKNPSSPHICRPITP
jgi:Glycosyltransferase (GlcNAc)